MKIKNLYNLDKFEKGFLKSAEAIGFCDSAAGIVIKENLKYIDPTIFEKKYPELVFLNSGFSADNSGGYSKVIQSLRTQPEGEFRMASDDASNKGTISIEGEDNLIYVYEKEAESKWTETQIQEANLQGINLQQKYLQGHLSIYQREIDKIIATGINGKASSVGLLNNTEYASGAASGAIETLTAQQMYDEIASLIVDQYNDVANTPEYKADKVMLPTDVFNLISKTILNSAGSTKSVLRSLMDNFPEIMFLNSFRAENVGGSSRTVAYSTNEQSAKIRIPLPLTVSEILRMGFRYHVESKYRIAGLDILESTSGRILTGL